MTDFSDVHKHNKDLYTIQDQLAWQPPPITRIIHEGVLNSKSRMLIFGDEGSWKSILALHTAHSIARGSRWLGFRTTTSNVFKLQAEMPMYMDRERTEKYCIGSKELFIARSSPVADTDENDSLADATLAYAYPERVISRTERSIHIDDAFGFQSLKDNIYSCIQHLPSASMVIILDPLFKLFGKDLSSEVDVKPMLENIDRLLEDTNSSIIIVHHTRKSVTDDKGRPVDLGSQDATGSRALVRWVDTILRVDPIQSDETFTRVALTFTKHRNSEGYLPRIVVRWDKGTLHPQITSRIMPTDEDMDIRGSFDLKTLE